MLTYADLCDVECAWLLLEQSSLWRDVPFGGGQLMLFEGIKAFILTSPDIDIDVGTLQVSHAHPPCAQCLCAHADLSS